MEPRIDALQLAEAASRIDEAHGSGSKIVAINGTVARYLDFASSKDDPTVQLVGMGTMSVSNLRKMIKMDLATITKMVDQGKAEKILASLTDPEDRGGLGILVGKRLQALAEVERFMGSGAGKRKIAQV